MTLTNIIKALRILFRSKHQFGPLYLASACYQRAKTEALRKHSETGKRYYCVWDPNGKDLITITYDIDRRNHQPDSWQYLRRRGLVAPLTRRQLLEGCFFYTASRGKDNEMPIDKQQQMLDVLRKRYFAR